MVTLSPEKTVSRNLTLAILFHEMMGKPEEFISAFLSVPDCARVCVGEETHWGFTPCAAKLMGLGFVCLLRRSS